MTASDFNKRVNAFAAATLLILATVLACLIFVDRCTTIYIRWPGFWYRSRSFHLLICISVLVAAWWAHRCAGRLPGDSEVVFRSVTVYSKPNCELCDRAIEILDQYDDALPEVRVVDISDNAELQLQHGASIPVVEMDGRVRFRGMVSVELLERMIAARQRRQSRHSAADSGSPV